MKANEFSKKGFFSTKYALGVSMAIEGDKTIESETRLAKEVILQWVADRGKSAAEILLTVVAPEADHESIATFLTKVVREEGDLAPLFRRLPFTVNLLALSSKAKKTLKLP